MKKIKVLLFIILTFFCFDSIAYAEWQIQYDTEADRVLYLGGDTLRGHFATGEECQDYWRSRPVFEQKHSKCVGYDSPKQGNAGGTTPVWGGGNINTDAGAKQFILGNLLGAILGNALNPTSPPVDTRVQQKLLWQKKQAAIEKENERKASLARWQALKDASALQRAEEQRQKKEQGRKLLASLDRVGSEGSLSMEPISSGSLQPFSKGNSDLSNSELQPIGTGRYDTSSLSALKRLSCAKYFSQAALDAANNGNDVKAKYLNQQAQKVMAGQMIDSPCQFSDLPNVPEVPKPFKVQTASSQKQAAYYEGLIKTVQQKAKKLQGIEMKLKQTDKKLNQAKEKKQKAEQKISKIKKSAALAKNQQKKKETDELEAAAQALLAEANKEIQKANSAKQSLLKQKKQIVTQLKKIQKKIQPKAEAN